MLKRLSKPSDFKEGNAFIKHTCDAIDPVTLHERNPHDELYICHKVKGDKATMLNITDNYKTTYDVRVACFIFEYRADL